MLLILSTPVLIRHLWLLKTVVFLHWCLVHTVPPKTIFAVRSRGTSEGSGLTYKYYTRVEVTNSYKYFGFHKNIYSTGQCSTMQGIHGYQG